MIPNIFTFAICFFSLLLPMDGVSSQGKALLWHCVNLKKARCLLERKELAVVK